MIPSFFKELQSYIEKRDCTEPPLLFRKKKEKDKGKRATTLLI
jgi:hypothetical protein